MRPGRILLFLLAVVLTLFILSLLTVSRQAGEVTLPDEQEISVHDSSGISYTEYDTLSDSGSGTGSGQQTGSVGDSAGTSGNTSIVTTAGTPAGREITPASVSRSTPALKPDETGTGNAAVRREPSAPYPGDLIRDSVAGGNQVRIIYYGDSQVEGDPVPPPSLRSSLRRSEVTRSPSTCESP